MSRGRAGVMPIHCIRHRRRVVIIGAVIRSTVIFDRPMIGKGTSQESGCTTKIVERIKSTKVLM